MQYKDMTVEQLQKKKGELYRRKKAVENEYSEVARILDLKIRQDKAAGTIKLKQAEIERLDEELQGEDKQTYKILEKIKAWTSG